MRHNEFPVYCDLKRAAKTLNCVFPAEAAFCVAPTILSETVSEENSVYASKLIVRGHIVFLQVLILSASLSLVSCLQGLVKPSVLRLHLPDVSTFPAQTINVPTKAQRRFDFLSVGLKRLLSEHLSVSGTSDTNWNFKSGSEAAHAKTVSGCRDLAVPGIVTSPEAELLTSADSGALKVTKFAPLG